MTNGIFEPRGSREILCSRNLQLKGQCSAESWNAEIIIGICLHNQAASLPIALASALAQSVVADHRAVILLLDDCSIDDWQSAICEHLEHPQLVVVRGNCGSPARTRNALLDYVDMYFPRARWVARLDADDELAHVEAVAALCMQGDAADARYVLGSNHLLQDGHRLPWSNIANPDELKNPFHLLSLINSFATGQAQRELPSCNLMLRVRSGIRYPEIRGAEDHWLVASLLILEPSQGAIVPYPVYSTYVLHGVETDLNKRSDRWSAQRCRLAEAARLWIQAQQSGKEILGIGQEGIVWREDGLIRKEFYPWAMSREDQTKLAATLARAPACIPKPAWKIGEDGRVRCSYLATPSNALAGRLDESRVRVFLKAQLESGVVASNIKRSNLMLSAAGELLYIDIGKDIVPFTVSRFLDAAARTYSVCVLGLSDHEFNRRRTDQRQHEALDRLPGFRDFFRKLIESSFPHLRLPTQILPQRRVAGDVSLLIKTCAQDAATIEDQVEHIVSQLAYPSSFASVILVVDAYSGPFLRQYAQGDPTGLLAAVEGLKARRVVDEVLVAPDDPESIRSVYGKWFANDSVMATHTTTMAPLFSQIWAFGRVTTRYVLQCDADVLIGRKDFVHDYLADMVKAIAEDDVLSVGFNIPKARQGFVPYHAQPGEYVPEIRLGLLDLKKVHGQLPIENPSREGRFELMWHRALERHQRKSGQRNLRGGDSRSFYIHPLNPDKAVLDLPKVRDLIAQGSVPNQQCEKWDLVAGAQWRYPARSEDVVFLLKGRDTEPEKLKRCFDSLRHQTDQEFGLIVIDDGGWIRNNWQIPVLLGDMMARTTLIRRRSRLGYLPNFIEAVEVVCHNPDSLIVTLDQDDALMSDQVVESLRDAVNRGVDLINGTMFRPDKPLQLYAPNYWTPRETGGGNVWTHLRGFRKSLFQQVPKDYFRLDGRWVDDVSDYAVMLPMAELAKKPLFIDGIYCYFHQREAYPVTRKQEQFRVIAALLEKQSLRSVEQHGGVSGG